MEGEEGSHFQNLCWKQVKEQFRICHACFIILICVFFFINEELTLNFQVLEHLISPPDHIVHKVVTCEPNLFYLL